MVQDAVIKDEEGADRQVGLMRLLFILEYGGYLLEEARRRNFMVAHWLKIFGDSMAWNGEFSPILGVLIYGDCSGSDDKDDILRWFSLLLFT